MTPPEELRKAAEWVRKARWVNLDFGGENVMAFRPDSLAELLEGAALMVENGQRPMQVREAALDLARRINGDA